MMHPFNYLLCSQWIGKRRKRFWGENVHFYERQSAVITRFCWITWAFNSLSPDYSFIDENIANRQTRISWMRVSCPALFSLIWDALICIMVCFLSADLTNHSNPVSPLELLNSPSEASGRCIIYNPSFALS